MMPNIEMKMPMDGFSQVVYSHPITSRVIDTLTVNATAPSASVRIGLKQLQIAQKIQPRKGEAKKLILEDINAYEWMLEKGEEVIQSYLIAKKAKLLRRPFDFRKTFHERKEPE